ncbi:MAG: M14 family metallopeptidase [Bacteroidia bacterium]|nr:M14 family metallopeptidase [Bacteroidia bacterium]
MNKFAFLLLLGCLLWVPSDLLGQNDYFFPKINSFDEKVPSPEDFLGYAIGEQHTRHDRLVSYMQELARVSERAQYLQLGMTYEYRPLLMLIISDPGNLARLEDIQKDQLKAVIPNNGFTYPTSNPILVNLGYNVHGNEPSSSEAAMLTAYYLVAGEGAEADKFRKEAVVFIDPVINPDGRDRHSNWANSYKGMPPVSDPADREHNEAWPRGRTNHFWFDLNRDWILLVHPESKSKLKWFHQWYPHVVTDFHEMGTNSTYFFEPMKPIGSKDPIMPEENYTTLNELFATYFSKAMNEIGSLYFSKERFDGTYPGYGSSYPDLQGGLALLFEQASSRGHLQESSNGPISFAFTIRNHLVNSLATVRAAVENKSQLYDYQKRFFNSAISRAKADPVKAYVFGDAYDQNRNRAFLDLLLRHKIEVFEVGNDVNQGGKSFKKGSAWMVPTSQAQYRLVQTMFETYAEYRDSVFYDASAWSLANAYGLAYVGVKGNLAKGNAVSMENNKIVVERIARSEYMYLMDWSDYYAPDALNFLQGKGIRTKVAYRGFTVEGNTWPAGTIQIPVANQKLSADMIYGHIMEASSRHNISFTPVNTGYAEAGVDLGSPWFQNLKAPKTLMLLGNGISSYEAGEVWHLLDTRVGLPVTKVEQDRFSRISLNRYNTMILVSGNYSLDSNAIAKISQWVAAGNTLITTRTASDWAIKKKLVKEQLVKAPKDTAKVERKPFALAQEIRGADQVGGTIFEVQMDLTHPLAFGYHSEKLPVYRNSKVFLAPSKSPYSTVAQYTADPHIDGYVSDKNLKLIANSAAVLVSSIGRGRVIMFSDNPNFRGTWYGTNKLFLNALFLGNTVSVPN